MAASQRLCRGFRQFPREGGRRGVPEVRWRLSFTFVLGAVAGAGQPAAGPAERVAAAPELGGRHVVPVFPPTGDLELIAPAPRGEPPGTALWRWHAGSATFIAELDGIRANQLRELPGTPGVRRLLLGGGVSLPGAGHGEVYAWRVVELTSQGPPRTLWQSTAIAGLPAGEEPFVAVDAGGARWAALVQRLEAGKATGGRLLVGELPQTAPSVHYEFAIEPPTAPALDPEAPWFVEFAGATRLLVVAAGLPMRLELDGGGEVRRTPLAVPSPPVRSAHAHAASSTLWLSDDSGAHHGFTLATGRVAPHDTPLTPTVRLGPQETGLTSSRTVGCLPDGLALLGARNGRRVIVFVRLNGQGKAVVSQAVTLPGDAHSVQLWLSRDGGTLVWAELVPAGRGVAPVYYRAAVSSLEDVR